MDVIIIKEIREKMMDIENIATSAVKRSIAKTEILKPFIQDGDKEPSWDGHIYIHENKRKGKKGLKRVPVQVKGVTQKRPDKKRKYSVDKIDLENYLREGGTFLFVVAISEDGEEEIIYYASLLPIKIKRLLANNKNDNVSVDIIRFPSESAKKETLMLDFFAHMKKQTGLENIEIKSIQDLKKSGYLESITATVVKAASDKRAPEDLFLDLETYAYANVKGSNIPLPLIEQISLSKVAEVPMAVSVDNKVYYNSFRRVKDKAGIHVEIGDSTAITIDNSQILKMNFKPTTLLPNAITDIEFFLDVSKNEGFDVNGERLEFKPFRLAENDKVQLKDTLAHHKDVVKVLDLLRLPHNVNILDFSKEDQRNTDRFIQAFIYNEPVSGLKENIPYLVKLDYLGERIAVVFHPTEDKNTYKLFDFFATTFSVSFEDDNGNMHRTSQFDVLSDEDYLELKNADLDAVIDSYKEIELDKFIAERANNMLLILLTAYDKSGDKRTDILNSASELSTYLLEKCSDGELEYDIRLINYAQCLKRLGRMDKTTQEELYKISEDCGLDICARISAKMLLGEKYSAKELLEHLSAEERNNMRYYPIYRYWSEA